MNIIFDKFLRCVETALNRLLIAMIIPIKAALIFIIEYALPFLSKVIFLLSVGLLVYAIFGFFAYIERGYMAYGGECMLAIAVFGVLIYLSFNQD